MATNDLLVGYTRRFAAPVDASSTFPTLSSLQAYASNDLTAYIGQICAVTGTNTVYVINNDKSVAIVGGSSLFPLGSSAYSSGGQYPSAYTIKNPSGTVIGYVNLTYDMNNRVTGVACTNASSTALTHGNWTISYDDSGNLTSVVCTN
jgi:hypothetical protein